MKKFLLAVSMLAMMAGPVLSRSDLDEDITAVATLLVYDNTCPHHIPEAEFTKFLVQFANDSDVDISYRSTKQAIKSRVSDIYELYDDENEFCRSFDKEVQKLWKAYR